MKAYHLTLQECIHLTKGLSIYLADDLKHLNDSQRFSTGELERFVVIILMMTMFASIIVLNCWNERKRAKEDVTKCHKAIHHFRFTSKNVNRANNSHCFHPVWLHDLHYNAIIIIEEFLTICYYDWNFNDDDNSNNNNNNISARQRSLWIRYDFDLLCVWRNVQ